jgi:hypothetical protein
MVHGSHCSQFCVVGGVSSCTSLKSTIEKNEMTHAYGVLLDYRYTNAPSTNRKSKLCTQMPLLQIENLNCDKCCR